MPSFRYSSPLIIPDASDVKDQSSNQEISYILNALRTLAAQVDSVTGALSPLRTAWPTTAAETSILGGNINKFYCICGANIAYGAMVNLYALSATRVQARPAQANGIARAAAGFCVTPGGFTAGSWGEFVVGPGVNYAIAGMVPGTWYYLDPTSALGQVTATKPVAAGQIVQLVGVAIRDNALMVGALNNWSLI